MYYYNTNVLTLIVPIKSHFNIKFFFSLKIIRYYVLQIVPR
jgi:hypothetical protein